MDGHGLVQWVGPTIDGALAALLLVVLWRLRQDPAATWREREQRLRAIFQDLRTLVAQAEGLARELDANLLAHAEHLRPGAAAGAPGGATPPSLAAATDQIRRLAGAGVGVDEIACRLGMAPAEVRLLIGLHASGEGGKKAPAESAT